jgi:hypothetical protein
LKRVKLPGACFLDVIRRGLSHGVKLTDIYGSGTIGKADWIRVQKTIRESEEITERKLDKMFH